MTIIRPDSLPRLWWLFPWSIARQLHKNAVAIREMADNQSTTITNQANILGRYMDENRELKAEVTRLSHSREHWIAKHDRAYAVAMHNERVIADMESRIIRGAITPDAYPHE
jgi:hypothetical protein